MSLFGGKRDDAPGQPASSQTVTRSRSRSRVFSDSTAFPAGSRTRIQGGLRSTGAPASNRAVFVGAAGYHFRHMLPIGRKALPSARAWETLPLLLKRHLFSHLLF